MKKLLLSAAVVALTFAGAQAQNKTKKNTKNDGAPAPTEQQQTVPAQPATDQAQPFSNGATPAAPAATPAAQPDPATAQPATTDSANTVK